MYYFVEIACVISELWMIQEYLNSFLRSKKRPIWLTIAICALFGGGVIALSFLENASFIRLIYTFVLVFVLGYILFDSKPHHSILLSIIFCVLVLVTDILTSLLLNAMHIDSEQLMQQGAARMIYLIADHILLFGIMLLVRVANRKRPEQMFWRIILPVLPSWIISALLCYLLAWQILIQGESLPLLYIVVLLGSLYTNLIIIYCTSTMQKQAEEQMEQVLAEHHYAMQQEYYEQFRIQQEETRALWHDLSKYIRAFQSETQAGETFSQLQNIFQSIPGVVDVNNRVVSVILNEYVAAAKEMDAELTLDVQIPDELSITAADLYILIGNTLENALNAVATLPVGQRKIALQLKLHNQVLFYRIQNPFSPEAKDKFHLTNRYHGYGIKNVRACVSKYDGELQTEMEHGVYTVTAHLNCC